MKEKLKPCPFCGEKNIDLWPLEDRGRKFKAPVCNNCGGTICENYVAGPSTKKLIKLWNRRSQ